jgi:hypothetical protein
MALILPKEINSTSTVDAGAISSYKTVLAFERKIALMRNATIVAGLDKNGSYQHLTPGHVLTSCTLIMLPTMGLSQKKQKHYSMSAIGSVTQI